MITHSDLDVTERDRDGRTLLHWAAYDHWHRILTVSLGKHDAPKNAQDKDGLTPLHVAMSERNLEGAQLLVLKGASTRIRGNRQYTPAHIAAEEGHRDIFEFLLSCESTTLGETAQSETTLLHLACAVDWEHIVSKLVVEYHFDVFAVDKAWKTPLHIAAKYGSARVAKCFISYGAPLEYGGIVGWTPVHLSVKGYDTKTVRLLIASGARTTTRTNQGQSCLHLAIQHQSYEIAEELLQHPGCADVCQPDHAGRSPLDLILADQGTAKAPETLFVKILGLSIELLRSTERQARLEEIGLRLRDSDRRHLLREIASSYHCSMRSSSDENPSQRSRRTQQFQGNQHSPSAHVQQSRELVLLEPDGDQMMNSIVQWTINRIVNHNDLVELRDIITKRPYLLNHVWLDLAVLSGGWHRNSLLTEAIWECKPEILTYCLEHGAEVNNKEVQPLIEIAYMTPRPNRNIIQILLEHGAKTDWKKEDGRGMLDVAKDVVGPEGREIEALLRHWVVSH